MNAKKLRYVNDAIFSFETLKSDIEKKIDTVVVKSTTNKSFIEQENKH